MTAYDL
ncbi:Glucose-6-phosphate/phosphate translocator 2 chloroplastic [Zea mays]|nr:Glucose-6-phosphate/phosphate translocator 2 chloroplastic [Zea mays]